MNTHLNTITADAKIRSSYSNTHFTSASQSLTHLVSQALDTTSMDPHGRTDESNTVATTGVARQERENLQIQAAPDLDQKVVLPRAQTLQLESTNMPLGSFTFASTNTAGDVLATISVGQIMQKNAVRRLFNDRRYARFDIRITVNVTGSPFSTGIILMGSIPRPPFLPGSVIQQDSSTAPAYTYLLGRMLALNHIAADVSMDGVYKFDIPWTHQNSWASVFDFSTFVNYANIYVVAGTTYTPPEGQASSVNFEVYGELINVEHFETTSLVSQALFQFGGQANTHIEQKMNDVNNSNLPIDVTGDHLDTKVDVPVGLDNPSRATNPAMSSLRNVYQKLISWRNVVDVFKFSATPADMSLFTAPLSKELRVEMDEMSMEFFRNRWVPATNLGTFAISTSTAVNTLLFQKRLDPVPFNSFNYANNFSTTTQGSFLTWLTSAFNYWRGSLKFRFLVASNKFIRGKLLIAINYGDVTALTGIAPGNLDPFSLPHLIVDLSNTDKDIEVHVPFKAVSELLRCRSPNQQNSNDIEFAMGNLGVWLVSPLRVNSGAATTVSVLPLMALGDDLNFYQEAPSPRIGLVAQALLTPRDMTSVAHLRQTLMTPFCNIKELLAKPVPIGDFRFVQPFDDVPLEPLVIPIHPVMMANNPLWSMVCASYSGLRGGYRVVIRALNLPASSSLRIQYFPYLVPTQGDASNTLPTTGGVKNFDFQATRATYDSTILNPYGDQATIPQMVNVGRQYPQALNTIPVGTVFSQASYGMPCIAEAILDPYSQPEVIIEVPDPSPMYRTQQNTLVPTGYVMSTATNVYNPFKDKNMGWLVIQPADNNQNTNPSDYVIQVSLMAADDTRAFWYNGGPTTLTPNSIRYNPTATAIFTSYFSS